MKKILSVLSFLYIINLFSFQAFAQAEEAQIVDFVLNINDTKAETKNPIVSIHNRTYLPLRELAEILDLYITWEDATRTICISNIGLTAESDDTKFALDKTETAYHADFKIKVDGYQRMINNSIYTINDRTYLPLREIAELLEIDVNWNEDSRTVELYSKPVHEESGEILIPFQRDGHYGYADDSGRVVIEPKYKIALPFSEGLAAVADENYKFGYIDVKGELVISHQYFKAENFSDGVAAVSNSDRDFKENESEEEINFILFDELAESYFYIDKNGDVVFDKQFKRAGKFCDGYAPVAITESENEGYYTYINKNGESFGIYDRMPQEFQSGYGVVENDIIDSNFEVVFNGDEYDNFSFKNGFIRAEKNGKYGVVDLNNEIIIDFVYDYLSDYSEGLFAFKTKDGCGYIDINENVVISPEYSYTDEFIDGRAMVIPEDNQNIMYFINKNNEKVSKEISAYYYHREDNGLTMIYPDNKGIYVNTKGEIIE